jgi:hypothetical protein
MKLRPSGSHWAAKPATLRAGLRRALKANEDVKMVQRGEETYPMREVKR